MNITLGKGWNNMETIGTVGLNIMKLRKKKGLTQMQLAEQMNVSFQAVSNWERGQSCPDIDRLREIASFFEVTVDEILGNKKPPMLSMQ